jgi:2-oxoisovalerate dehydrogenase E1 component
LAVKQRYDNHINRSNAAGAEDSALTASKSVGNLRSITPLDEELIYRSVRRTNRVVIAHENSHLMEFGAEIATRIASICLDPLDAPVRRVAAKDSFVPSAPSLESLVLPSTQDVCNAVEQTLRY